MSRFSHLHEGKIYFRSQSLLIRDEIIGSRFADTTCAIRLDGKDREPLLNEDGILAYKFDGIHHGFSDDTECFRNHCIGIYQILDDETNVEWLKDIDWAKMTDVDVHNESSGRIVLLGYLTGQFVYTKMLRVENPTDTDALAFEVMAYDNTIVGSELWFAMSRLKLTPQSIFIIEGFDIREDFYEEVTNLIFNNLPFILFQTLNITPDVVVATAQTTQRTWTSKLGTKDETRNIISSASDYENEWRGFAQLPMPYVEPKVFYKEIY